MKLCSLIFLQLWIVQGLKTWSYDDQESWTGRCRSGNSQSPIDLVVSTFSTKPIERLFFSNSYRYKLPCTLNNDGNNLRLTFGSEKAVNISGGELNGNFVLSHVLFFWGAVDKVGSEHLVNGKAYPLETQLVHYNSKYKSAKNAESKSDGIAIFSTLFSVSDRDNIQLKPLFDSIQRVSKPGKSVTLTDNLKPNYFLPRITSPLYRYMGSQTSPPCAETVSWTVFYNVEEISSRQLTQLRTVQGEDGQFLGKSRKVKPLNGRQVYVGQAYLQKKEITVSTTTVKAQKEYLQLGSKSSEFGWWQAPSPLWVVFFCVALMGFCSIMTTWLLIRRFRRHTLVPTDEIEMD